MSLVVLIMSWAVLADSWDQAVLGVLRALGCLTSYLLPVQLSAISFLDSSSIYMSAIRYGEWAIVTGATDGIGRAYADGNSRSNFCTDKTDFLYNA